MIREEIPYSNEAQWLKLRANDVTSTEVAALFNISPYLTAFELWNLKRGEIEDNFKTNERVHWGDRLEQVIAEEFSKKIGVKTAPFKSSTRLPEFNIGASFDWQIIQDGKRAGIIEIKNVDKFIYHSDWTDEEMPLHIEMQVQVQMLVSGIDKCHVAVLVGGNELKHYERDPRESIQKRIFEEVANFWEREEPPAIDYTRDGDVISRLYGYGEPGKVLTDTNKEMKEHAKKWKEIVKKEKELNAQKLELKTKFLEYIQDSEKYLGDEFTVSAGTVSEVVIEKHTKKSHRRFRLFFKKGFEDENN
jgi:putative phage-type endonuclease